MHDQILTHVDSDFIENRKAAQAIKARVEQYERNGGGARFLGEPDEGYVPTNKYVSGEDRIAQVKAEREKQREKEMVEKERQVCRRFI